MRKEYLQRLVNKNEVQKAMILLNKGLVKYSKISFNSRKRTYNINNFWLRIDVNVTEKEFNYISNKMQLA